ncbi:MAG: ATP-binding cassette domain-containing protein [Candidatus Methanomethylophilaceae archaeon]|nr:ATP-binding cassette domain-containing protein [Candidatus Methanomethylophilaceae archaeon]MDD2778911.1 ATP-binding cassette domain-containing protein [Candidatus Methanomethylophilaceae archaeon]MDD3128205.1 ATP-binding cassette domain-containing protein [Candidatus Methanomethylophilaceae archaeon]
MLKALEMQKVSVVKDGRRILDSIDLDVDADENVAIIGPNGSGKTTLIKLIRGEVLPYYDEDSPASIRIFGMGNWNLEELRKSMGIVSMDLQSRFPPDTPLYEVMLSGYFGSMGIFRNHKVTESMASGVLDAARTMGLENMLEASVGVVSLGEMRRALIARALAPKPRMLVLDEPMTGLDVVMRDRFRRMFDIMIPSGISVMMITHELEDIPLGVRRVIMLKEGRKMADGPKEKVLTSGNLSRLFDEDIEVSESGGVYRMRLKG